MVYKITKRFLDIFLSLLSVAILWPLMLVIMLAIKIDSKGPAFLRQRRIGIHKKHFYILKFRTMRRDTPQDMAAHLLEQPDLWVTKVGHLLRHSSLDELPQLLNILKGDMSFVGPRPALWNQYDLIEARDLYGANDVPVGLTGWAQINGRDDLPVTVKARYDGEYVRRRSLLFDMSCFLRTFAVVFSGKGVR